MITVLQTNAFSRSYKRLQRNQQAVIDTAVATIVDQLGRGEAKKGDLAGVFVYKFPCAGQQFLLTYECDAATRLLLLVGTHENFCRNLKR